MSRFVAYLVVFCTGITVLIVELLGPRMLAPLFGTSIHVWSAVISVTLAALAVGYWIGGFLADFFRGSLNVLVLLLVIAATLVGLLPFVSPAFQTCAFEIGGVDSGALLAASLLFVPPLVFLGTVCPFVAGCLVRSSPNTGRAIGGIYAVSTLGSIIGSLTSAYVLVPHFGLTVSFYISSLITVAPAVVVLRSNYYRASLCLWVSIGIIGTSSAAESTQWRDGVIRLHKETVYGDIKVLDNLHKRVRYLLVDGAYQNIVSLDNFEETPVWYVRAMDSMTAFSLNDQSEVAIIGMGSGILPNLIRPFVKSVSVVEINPSLIPIAESYFAFNPNQFKLYIQDGRQFFQRKSEPPFDAIILDVFNGTSIPFHLFTREAFQEMRGYLRANGFLLVNFLGFTHGENSKLFASVYATLSREFPFVSAYSNLPADFDDSRSVVFVASLEAFDADKLIRYVHPDPLYPVSPDRTGKLLTDELNPTDLWAARINSRWKEKTVEQLGISVLIN